MNAMDRQSDFVQIDVRYYLRVPFKRRWTILNIVFAVLVIAALFILSATPVYRASSRIVIEKENPNLMSIQEVLAVDSTGSDYYQTQYKIIESRAVAKGVIKRLQLGDDPEFLPKPADSMLARLKAWVSAILDAGLEFVKTLFPTNPEPPGAAPGEVNDSKLIDKFIDRVSVSPIRNSRLVDVSVEATNPQLAARMTNELVRTYIDQNMETKLAAAKDAVKWLNERIDDERQKVEAAETALLLYKENHGIITDFSSENEKITAQKLASLNEQVIRAESDRVEAETRYRQAMEMVENPGMLDSIPEVLDSQIIQEIKKLEVSIYNRMSELSKKYGRKHPQMVALESELGELRKRKIQESRRVVSSLKNQFRLAKAKEASLKEAFAQQKRESLEMNKKAIQFGVLQRQAESSRHMYELLIKRFKETSLAEEMKTGNIRIIDAAEVPQEPVKPKKKLLLVLALFFGLSLGVGFAFVLEHLDNTIKVPDEVKTLLKIPYLGPVPRFKSDSGLKGRKANGLIAYHEPKSTASESFRGIRTGILYSSADKIPQVVLVTSSGPYEGKTTCASNLAVVMGQAGSKVLLIDCDMRRPRIHNEFQLPRSVGFSSLLVGSNDADKAIFQSKVDNLDVIPAGPIPPNPSEIIGSERMIRVLNEFRESYDRIIIDSPPITAVTDSVVLSNLVDGVVLVIRAGETPRPIVKNGISQLKSVDSHILGAVLNAVDTSKHNTNYYQYYYYYYGEEHKRRKRDHFRA
jgi:succinoglycan biosynthesis transport protein ExoP